jgi:hypothetical protein
LWAGLSQVKKKTRSAGSPGGEEESNDQLHQCIYRLTMEHTLYEMF